MSYSIPQNEAMPMEAVAVAIPVLVWSILCLGLCILVVLMQHYHSERWSCAAPPDLTLS